MKSLPQRGRMRRKGFTLVEVIIAGAVLAITIASCLSGMRIGFGLIESARDNALASQIMQNEIENLRLKNWKTISALPRNASLELSDRFVGTAAERFTCRRVVEPLSASLREVQIEIRWVSYNGQEQTRKYVTYFSEEGLNDYFYRAIR